MRVTQKAKQFTKLITDFDKLSANWLYEGYPIMEELLLGQWDKGLTGDDSKKMPAYKYKSYKKLKKQMGSQSQGRYDLKLTGDFRSGLFAIKKRIGVQFSSRDEKLKEINTITRGYDIWTLNSKSRKSYIEKTLKSYVKLIKNQI